MRLDGLLVFAATYVLISARRLDWLGLDRPAGALLGAVATVVLGVLTPTQALAAVDLSTLLLLLGVMGMGAFLAVDGFFDRAQALLVRRARTPARLLAFIVWGAGILSAFVTNDAVCVLGAPLVVALVVRCRLPPLPFLLALATAANTGSVATLVGNPQNMLCATLGDLSFARHLLWVGPVGVVGLAMNHAILWMAFREVLAGHGVIEDVTAPDAPAAVAGEGGVRTRITFAVILATVVAYTWGTDLSWTAAAGFALLMLLHRRDTRGLWRFIDGPLLLFFAALFVVVAGLSASGAPQWFFAAVPLTQDMTGWLGGLRLSGLFLLGSNVVSNVPFILVVAEPMAKLEHAELGWELLAMASTFAGNLTLLGSVANIIVAESARELGGIGFWEHLRIGLPVALSTTLVGTLWLLWIAGP